MARGGAFTRNIVRTSQNTEFGCRCKHQVFQQRERRGTAGFRNLRARKLHGRDDLYDVYVKTRKLMRWLSKALPKHLKVIRL
jgi:hypothetical protein